MSSSASTVGALNADLSCSFRSHKFWATQPVIKLGTRTSNEVGAERTELTPLVAADEEIHEGPLEPNRPIESIRKEPYDLHNDLRWVSVDLSNPVEVSSERPTTRLGK